MGMPITCSAMSALTIAAEVHETLEDQHLPIRGVFCPPHAVSHLVVVSTEVPYANFAKRIAHAVWATQAGQYCYYVIVVEDDVDPTDIGQVLHALTTKCHPVAGIHQVSNAPSFPILLPFLEPADRLLGNGAYVLFDCTWPKKWQEKDIPAKSSFDTSWPEDIRRRVIEKWRTYGYTD
jgi:4-hydroxy-3-polyprenylbenzoate decarboxylase